MIPRATFFLLTRGDLSQLVAAQGASFLGCGGMKRPQQHTLHLYQPVFPHFPRPPQNLPPPLLDTRPDQTRIFL